jgi:hypothetical protein
MQERLEAIDPERLKSAIRIALIHHHPVLIPDLVEAGRGYDAVHHSAALLTTFASSGSTSCSMGTSTTHTSSLRTQCRRIARGTDIQS